MIKLVILLCFFAGTQAQRIFLGECPNVNLQENFQVEKYTGKWYEMQRYFAIFEFLQYCVTADYQLLSDGKVSVNNTGFSYVTGSRSTAIGDAIQDPNNPAKLGVKFGGSPARGDYWVVSTDYNNYSIVFSCSRFFIWNLQFAWVLTREPTGLSPELMGEVNRILDANGIRRNPFSRTSQENCPQ